MSSHYAQMVHRKVVDRFEYIENEIISQPDGKPVRSDFYDNLSETEMKEENEEVKKKV